MEFAAFILLAGVLFLSYANGANDNFKGVATLYGSRTAEYRGALWWATATTFAGAVAAFFLATKLAKNFSGSGLVPSELVSNPGFLATVALAAAITVQLATRLGIPISTTHALVGSLVGAGLAGAGGHIAFARLNQTFLVPLIASPFMSLALTIALYPLLRRARRGLGVTRETCLCVGETARPVRVVEQGGQVFFQSSGVALTIDQKSQCMEQYQGTVFGVSAQSVLDRLHFLSAGAVSFARGLNDAPKIFGLLVVAQFIEPNLGVLLVGIMMAVGGLLNARRVAESMSRKITPMNHGQGLTANFVTAGLVIAASRFGLPVSTTHVSVGSLFGLGICTGKARWKMIATILVAWVTTLPLAALIAAALARILI